ncbi:hypothetical protein J6590_100731 [Homalodisca vitripennis]|nr:hypothetical protein J6590_100731 [Homalodisca vitripennis]
MLLVESREKIAVLTAERQCLVTSIEVLEADVRALRVELRQAESRARQRRTSADDSLLAEMTLAEASCPPPPATLTAAHQSTTSARNSIDQPTSLSNLPVPYAVTPTPSADRYRGGPGYNGGHGKREALHSMADLLFTVKTNFQNSKIFLDSVLIRRDIGYKALHDFNLQLELMCNNFDVEFVEANTCVSRRDLTRDGVHFSRRGVTRLGSLFVNAITAGLRYLDAAPANDLGEDMSSLGLSPGPGNTISSDHDPSGSCDVSRVPGN